MAIKAITGTVPVSSYINFSSRKSKDVVPFGEGNVTHNRKTSKLKQVPVIVMIAMSPLSTKALKIKPIELNAPKIEMVTSPIQNGDPQVKMVAHRDMYADDGSRCVFARYQSVDGEFMVFQYENKIDKDFVSTLQGNVRAICKNYDPYTKHHIMVYDVLDPKSKIKGTRICKIPHEYAEYLLNYQKTDAGRKTIATGTVGEFAVQFGTDVVSDAPDIMDETNCRKYRDGRVLYVVPVSVKNKH